MKHIFVIHSNICSIVVVNTIRQLVKNNEKIVLITYRNTKWPFNRDGIEIVDFTQIDRENFVTEVKSIKDWIKRRRYLKSIEKHINTVVNDSDYILYIPNYAVHYQTMLAENKYCRGYYFIEEGSLAYTPLSELMKEYNHRSWKTRAKVLFGLTDKFYYEITNKFQGTISISDKAFEWNDKEKIVDKVPDFGNLDYPCYQHIVVTGFFDKELSRVKHQLSILLNYMDQHGINQVAIKYHPHIYDNYPEKIDEVGTVFNDFESVKVVILPPSFIVEYSIIKNGSTVYSIDGLSSLSFYSVLFGARTFNVDEEGVKELEDLASCIDCLVNV